MRVGYVTNGLTSHRLDDAIRLLADEGFEVVAISPDVGHLDPFRCSASERSSIAALLAQTGLACVIESGARYVLDPRRKHRPNLLEADAEGRARRLDFLRRCLELGEELGAEALSFWAGHVPEGEDRARVDARLEDGIRELLEHSDRHGVPLAFEPEPGMAIETVAEALALRQRLGEPERLGLCIDLGHLYVTGEGSPAEILPPVLPLVRQLHVEDIRRGVHEHLEPGCGDVDFREIGATLRAHGYGGPICWELSRSGHSAVTSVRKAKLCFDRQILNSGL